MNNQINGNLTSTSSDRFAINNPVNSNRVADKPDQISHLQSKRIKPINQSSHSRLTLSCNKVMGLVLSVIGYTLAIFGDLLVLPLAGLVLLAGCIKKDFYPKTKHVKKDKTPILFLHGNGFFAGQWIVAKQFVKGEEFGSAYACSYGDGLVRYGRNMGIHDYSADIVRKQIRKIKNETGQNKIILIGHSMGSLVGEDYAQRFAKKDGIRVTNILSISTPWQGSPTVDLLGFKSVRHQQMSQTSGEPQYIQYRKDLIEKALKADRAGKRVHWNIWSKHDHAVPGTTGRLTENPNRHYQLSGIGHYVPMISPRILLKMRSWVKEMITKEGV